MARLHTGRLKVLSTYRSYHGGTQTAINLTGDPRRWANDTATAGTVHFFGPFLYRSEFHATTEAEECERALAHLDAPSRPRARRRSPRSCSRRSPAPPASWSPPPGYLAGVRELCDRHGIVLILDEVMAGFGRAGQLARRSTGTTSRPDLITFAKGVNSGYVPLGGVIISDAIAATFAHRAYPGGLTYSGHPLACAAAVATIHTMRDEGIVENADRLGREVFGPGLAEIADRHACVGEVRGVGAFWALDLVTDRETRAPLAPYGGSSPDVVAVVQGLPERGLLPFANTNRIHVVPPCTMSDEEAREGLAILDDGAPGRRRARLVTAHLTAYERHAPDAAARRRRAGADSGTAVFWLEDARGPTYDPLTAPTRADLTVVGGGYCGLWTAVLAKRRNPGARVVLLEAQHRRVGGVRAQRRLLRGQPDPRRGERPVPLARRVRRARAARARPTSTPSRPTSATSAWTASSSAPAALIGRGRGAPGRVAARARRDFLDAATPCGARSTARSSSAGEWDRDTARWCTRPGSRASWRGSPPTSASRSTSTRVTAIRRAGDVVELATDRRSSPSTASRSRPTSSPSLLRRTRLLTVPVYDYVLMTEPLTADQLRLDRLGRTGRGSATSPTSSTTPG